MKKFRTLAVASALSSLGLGAMIAGGHYGIPVSHVSERASAAPTSEVVNSETKVATKASDMSDMVVVQRFDDWTSNISAENPMDNYVWTFTAGDGDVLCFDWALVSDSYGGICYITLDGETIVEQYGPGSRSEEFALTEGTHELAAMFYCEESEQGGVERATVTNLVRKAPNPAGAAIALLAELDAYPQMKALLQAECDKYEAAEEADKEAALFSLNNLTVSIQQTLTFNDKLAECIAQAEAVLAEHPEETAIQEALDAAKAIETDALVNEEKAALKQALTSQVLLFSSQQVPMEEWSFGNTVYQDTIMWKFDTEHHLAEYYGARYNTTTETLAIPENVTYNGEDYAVVSVQGNDYSTNSSVHTIVLPQTLRRIGDYAFGNYQNLWSLDIPAHVTNIGNQIFHSSSSVQMRAYSPAPAVCDANAFTRGSKHRVIIPDGSFHAYRIATGWSSIPMEQETPTEAIANVVDPGDLGLQVLEQRGYLQEVNKLTVSGELNAEDWATLQSMTNLKEVDMSGLLNTSIPDQQFSGRWFINKVVLPANLQTIESYAFKETGITDIIFPESLRSIKEYAFQYCRNLREIEIPNGVSEMKYRSFGNCYSLTRVKLPEGLTYIPEFGFSGCNLQELSIPASVTTIKNDAFANNRNLKAVHFSEGLTKMEGSAFYQCNLDTLRTPSTLKTIGNNCFYNNSSLVQVDLNEGLETIEYSAFANCTALTEIVLPSSLRQCTGTPFYQCHNLQSIYARSVIPAGTGDDCPLSSTNFNSVVLYVPTWSLQEYQLAPGWRDFMTVEVTDFMPQNVVINKDFTFSLAKELSPDYRPNIYLDWTGTRGTDSYGNDYYEHGNLTINSRSKLPANEFFMHISPLAKVTSDQNESNRLSGWSSNSITQWNSNSLIVNGEMRAENVDIMYTFEKDRWQFFSVPFDVAMKDIVAVDTNLQWVVREYSSANRAAGNMSETWLNVGSDDILKAGKGYVLHCTGRVADFHLTPVKESVNRQAIFNAEDRVVELEENLSEFEHNRSWNLIGNPYPSFYDTRFLDFDAPLTVWNSYNRSYVAYSPVDDSYILSPGESFFVQKPVDQETITFAKEGRQTHLYPRILSDVPERVQAFDRSHRTLYNIILQGENGSDRTRVVINEKAQTAYEMNRDAGKFMSMDSPNPQLFSLDGNVRYAINERPLGNAEVALGIYATQTGEYILRLADDTQGSVIVEDRLTGTFTEISSTEGYVFSAQKGMAENRFFLHFEGGESTGIENVGADATDLMPGFDISGRSVDTKTYKGIIVQKGRKLLKK